jgi:hypothetical protein
MTLDMIGRARARGRTRRAKLEPLGCATTTSSRVGGMPRALGLSRLPEIDLHLGQPRRSATGIPGDKRLGRRRHPRTST